MSDVDPEIYRLRDLLDAIPSEWKGMNVVELDGYVAALPNRLGTEFGYGMAMFAGGFTGTRNVGFAYAGDRHRLDEGIGIAGRKEDDTLRLRLNRALGSIFADGTYQKINAKSLPFSIY